MTSHTDSSVVRLGYFQGNIVPAEEIRISPYDLGVLRGYGVFDVMRTEGRVPFLWEKHWDRLVRSAEMLGLSLPIRKEEYLEVIFQLAEKFGEDRSVIRTILTGGVSSDGFSIPAEPTCFLLIEPFEALPNEYFERGVSAMTLEHRRAYPQAKTTNYVEAIRHSKEKKAKNAFEILYTVDGNVLEGSTSNIAIVREGTLFFPKEGILLGITRGLTLDLARNAGFAVREESISLDALLSADEAFLMATNKYIVPVVSVNGKVIGAGGVPGKVTMELMRLMAEYVHEFRKKNLA